MSIELSDKLLKVYYQSEEVAVHTRMKDKGQFSTEERHYPKYKRYSDTGYQEKYQVKMSEIGEYAEQIFFLMKERTSNNWLRPVKGIVSLLKSYPKEVVNLSCRRAIAYGVYQYQTIKKICFNGSYVLPLEFYGEYYANN